MAKARLLYSSEFFVQEGPGLGDEGTDLTQKRVSQVWEELGQLLTELMYPGVSQKQDSHPDPTSGSSGSRYSGRHYPELPVTMSISHSRKPSYRLTLAP